MGKDWSAGMDPNFIFVTSARPLSRVKTRAGIVSIASKNNVLVKNLIGQTPSNSDGFVNKGASNPKNFANYHNHETQSFETTTIIVPEPPNHF